MAEGRFTNPEHSKEVKEEAKVKVLSLLSLIWQEAIKRELRKSESDDKKTE